MDLSLGATEARLAVEVRAWLAENVEPQPEFDALSDAALSDAIEWGRSWQARLAAAGWVGIDWPAEYGGRGATPVEVAVFNSEYARSRAPQLVNRVGINLAGPTLLAHGTDEQLERWLRPITTADEIWCQLFSEPGAGSDLAGLYAGGPDRGWMARLGPEGLDLLRAVRRLGTLSGAYRSGVHRRTRAHACWRST